MYSLFTIVERQDLEHEQLEQTEIIVLSRKNLLFVLSDHRQLANLIL
jgi:hypothetical protein